MKAITITQHFYGPRHELSLVEDESGDFQRFPSRAAARAGGQEYRGE